MKVAILIMLQGISWDVCTQKIKVQTIFDNTVDDNIYFTFIPPEFRYGNDSLERFIWTHLVYPKMALDNNIFGQVVLHFVVEKDGNVGNVYVKTPAHPLLDEEAVRVIWLTDSLWKPALRDKKPINSLCEIPIFFEIEETDTVIYDKVDVQAHYLGGNEAFLEVVIRNFNYPRPSVNGEIIDYYDIIFVVNQDSTISDIHVKNADTTELWKACEKEIRRVLSMSNKKWVPAKLDGSYVRQRMRMLIYTCFLDED